MNRDLTCDQFVANLARSRLIGEGRIEAIRAELAEAVHTDPPALAEALVARGLITPWQSGKLLAGADKGFFLGKHKLLRLVASSSMSSVYEAEHLLMHRRVALKVLPKGLIGDGSFLERFYREARAVARLNHPNIIRGFDVGQDGDHHFFAMEFCQGVTLQDMVEASGPLTFEMAADLIRQAALGLAHAHDAGFVHRDIKPANLLRDVDGTVKILDLGLVRWLALEQSRQAGLTRTHDEGVLGTVDYLSPEQAVDSHNVDIRSDIYSLGCTLYFLIAGEPPFFKGSLAERLLAHQTQTSIPLTVLRPEIPPSLSQITSRMLAKRPGDRYQVPGEVAAALGDWLVGYQTLRSTPANLLKVEAPDRLPKPMGEKRFSQGQGLKPGGATIVQQADPSRGGVALDDLPDDGDPASRRPLAECWARWAGVIEAISSIGVARQKPDGASYPLIYQELMQACRHSARDADDALLATIREIEDLASPWPTLSSLRAILSSEMKVDILHRYRNIDRTFRKPTSPVVARETVMVLVASLAALALIYWAFFTS